MIEVCKIQRLAAARVFVGKSEEGRVPAAELEMVENVRIKEIQPRMVYLCGKSERGCSRIDV